MPKHIILLTINYSTLFYTAGSSFPLIEARAKTISYRLCFQRPWYTANALNVLEETDAVMCKGTLLTQYHSDDLKEFRQYVGNWDGWLQIPSLHIITCDLHSPLTMK